MLSGTSRGRWPWGTHKALWLAGMAGLQVALVASGLLLATTTARATHHQTTLAITDGTCAGGGTTYCYSPEFAYTVNGTSITWVDLTSIFDHSISSCTPSDCPGAPANTGTDWFSFYTEGYGTKNSYTFISPGKYTYFCRVHGYGAMHGTITVSGSPPIEDDNPKVSYASWTGFHDTRATGGWYRASATANARARFTFTGTGVTWVTRRGPDQGIASVNVDGKSQGRVDLYAPAWQRSNQTYSGLTAGTHTIDITVTGGADPSSTAAFVAVDAFIVGSTTTEESSSSVQYDGWKGAATKFASGGTYRYNDASGGAASLAFRGSFVTWVTATGPDEGIAAVSIDGVAQAAADLYSPKPAWHVFETRYPPSSTTPHTIVIKATGTKNASSKGTKVVVDALLASV